LRGDGDDKGGGGGGDSDGEGAGYADDDDWWKGGAGDPSFGKRVDDRNDGPDDVDGNGGGGDDGGGGGSGSKKVVVGNQSIDIFVKYDDSQNVIRGNTYTPEKLEEVKNIGLISRWKKISKFCDQLKRMLVAQYPRNNEGLIYSGIVRQAYASTDHKTYLSFSSVKSTQYF
jgi:hypothetical protein